MKKQNIVKKNSDFSDIIKTGKRFCNQYYKIFIKKSKFNYQRFGFAIPTKIGKAVERNKIKRQLKQIIDNEKLKYKNYDYIILPKRESKDLDFLTKSKFLISLLKQIEGEINEKNS